MSAPIWKRAVDIPLRVKIQQEQVHVSQSETYKHANAEAEFKQSMQCCSQWGLTSRSKLWNVERSMIKTAERALRRAHKLHIISAHIHRQLVWLCTRPLDLCFAYAYWLTHRNMGQVYCKEFMSYKFKDKWDVKDHHTQNHWKHLKRETDQACLVYSKDKHHKYSLTIYMTSNCITVSSKTFRKADQKHLTLKSDFSWPQITTTKYHITLYSTTLTCWCYCTMSVSC